MGGAVVAVRLPHGWPESAEAAVAIQEDLREQVQIGGPTPVVRAVAGLDVSYAKDSELLAAAVVVLDADTLAVLDQVVVFGRVTFPYLPGLFAFREMPSLVAALEKLDTAPDLLLCDGQGVAHPRRFGLACHLGVLTGLPSIGVAKTPMGPFEAPGPERGAVSPLRDGDEVVGRALRTQDKIKPVFVSVGHRIDLHAACAQVLRATGDYRLPEAIRLADQYGRTALRDGRATHGPARHDVLMLQNDSQTAPHDSRTMPDDDRTACRPDSTRQPDSMRR